MAYYNNADDASFYPTSTAFGELDAYPLLNQISAIEGENIEAPHTLTNDWNVGGQPDYMVGSLTGLGAEPSFGKNDCSPLGDWCLTSASLESVPSVTSYAPQTNGYDQSSYPEHYWPVNGQYAESYRSGVANRDDSFFSTGESEYPTVVPTPGSGKHLILLRNFEGTDAHRSRTAPLDYWGDSESGPSTSTFYTVSARARSSYTTLLTPPHRTCKHRTNPVLV